MFGSVLNLFFLGTFSSVVAAAELKQKKNKKIKKKKQAQNFRESKNIMNKKPSKNEKPPKVVDQPSLRSVSSDVAEYPLFDNIDLILNLEMHIKKKKQAGEQNFFLFS